MSQEKNRVLAGELVSRASVEAATGSLDDALNACDFDLAASIALSRAKAGDAPDAHAISRILAGLEFPPIATALVATVRDRTALLDHVAAGLYPRTKDAGEIETIVLYAAWKAGASVEKIIPPLRRLAARQLTAEAYALLATIAEKIDDANVRAATKPIATFAKEYAKSVAADDKALNQPIDAAIAALPAAIESSRGGFTVRAAATVGRNDPCPCGSGLKYKKCCADKPQTAAAPSPIPGVSWDEFIAGDKLTPEHIDELALKDLVRVDVSKVSSECLGHLASRFAAARQWTHVERVVEQASGRDGAIGQNLRELFVDHLLEVEDVEWAKHHLAGMPREDANLFHLELAIRERGATAYNALVDFARTAVENAKNDDGKDNLATVELAHVLLRAEPVLGILAARACIGAWLVDDAELLLEAVEEARDRLNLPPTDPAWDVYDTIVAGDTKRGKKGAKAEGDVAIREAMAESSAKIDQLERALAAVRTELADAKTRPAAELVRQGSSTGSDKLGERVRELEALIREGNEERRELRKQLEAAASTDSAQEPRPGAHDDDRPRRGRHLDDDDAGDDGDALEPGSRNVAIPRFERRALDAIAEVPATVAAETMRTVGTLAAGDPFAWRGVKAAKDMPRQVLMQRVGIHHRLIFRSEGGNLDVLDLITREQLQTTLKRLRQGR
ncbi:MAG TPA: SEC-C metal-binding domain-containing protein [Kofleriaceae bacterium]|nr:SEC-C metal-binding domain-containing protein [Kofleriaceae bacterium]